MEIKQGDIIQDDYSKDVWKVISVANRNGGWLKAECLDVGVGINGTNTYYTGLRRDFPCYYTWWRILSTKSLNFNNLYEKLQGRG